MTRFSPGFLHTANGNDQYTKILLHMDGANGGTVFTDSNAGGSAHTWTATQATTVTSGQKFGTAIMQSSSTNGRNLDTPAHADFNLGSVDWTIDFWFNTLGVGTLTYLAGQGPSSGLAASTPFGIVINGTDKVRADISNGSAFTSVTGTTSTLAAGLHHYEVSRNGNVLRAFLDGVQEGGDVAFSGTIPSATNNFAIGRFGEAISSGFGGLIDEFRLSVGIARHTANFTPPTSAYS